MTIARLEIKNFRCLGEVGIDLHPKLTFLAAHNAAGKSSVLDAIQWAIAGRCRGTDLKGAGSRNLIRDEEPSAQVKVIFTDGTYQTRQVSLKGGTLLDPPDGVAVNKDVLAVLCDGAAFLNFAHKDAKALLLDVLDVQIVYGGETLTLAQLDAKYDMAFNNRRDAKAKLNAIQIPALPAGEVPDVDGLDKKLVALRAEEHVLAAKEAHGGGKREAVAAQLTRAKATLTKATADWEAHPKPAELEAQIAALDALAAPDDKAESKATERAKAEQADVAGQLSKLRDGTAWLSKHSPSSGCVMSKSVPCNTPAEAFKTHLATLKGEVTALETRQKELAAQLKADEDATAKRQKAGADRAALVAAREKAETLQKTALAADTEVDRLTAELDALPAETGPSPALITLRARIVKGEEVVRAAREVVRQRIAHEDATTAQAAAAEALQALETVVADLGPKGVRVKALADTIGAFTDSINNALTPFGYTLAFKLDPWDVVVNGRSAELLSTSERLRVGVAFALALAEVTGVGFVAIDSADLLDGAGRAVLSELLDNWQAGQVIVAATRAEPLPSGDGYLAYWLSREPEGPTTIAQA